MLQSSRTSRSRRAQMPTRQSRAAGARALVAPKVPSFREEELTPLGGGRVGRPRNLPELVLFGTGRLMLNVAAVGLLSPKKPVRAIRLYLAEKDSHRYLVIQPAPDSAADAIHIYPSGRHYKRRWPAVVLAWRTWPCARSAWSSAPDLWGSMTISATGSCSISVAPALSEMRRGRTRCGKRSISG